MNILFIIPNFKIKGSHVPMARIANELSKRKDSKVYIYNIHPLQDPSEDYSLKTIIGPDVIMVNNVAEKIEIKKTGVLSIDRVVGKIKNRLTRIQLDQLIKNKNIEVVNSHAFLADLFVHHHKESFKDVIKISTWHGCYESTYNDLEGEKKEHFGRDLINTFNTSFDAIVNVSEKQKNYIKNVFQLKTPTVRKIYYGIDTQNLVAEKKPYSYNKLHQQLIGYSLKFGMISANDPSKGWEELIISFNQIKKKTGKKIALILIGGQELFQEYRKTYPSVDIFYVDKVDNPLMFMKLFDVGILPSYYPAENLPNVIIEYLLSGLSIISTQWAEIPLMIDSEGNKAGELIPLINGKPRIEDLQEAMIKYLEDPSKIERESILAEKIVKEKFCIQKIGDDYSQLFKELLERKNSNVSKAGL